jgi:cyclomaltodextrinase / maltogenic alpha-amylase / neopullulanase
MRPHFWSFIIAFAIVCSSTGAKAQSVPARFYANAHDDALQGVFEAREKDWRNGAVVYQVLVDRFAPPRDLNAKRHLYPAPKVIRQWSEPAARGPYRPEVSVWAHEIDFWGGDLESLRGKLGYVEGLGVDVLYLNPIHAAYTNHKYDAIDFKAISEEYGTRKDLLQLIEATHARKMKIVLDGAFNHMGRSSPAFKDAQANTTSPFRNWFYFDRQFPGGARAWARAENVPELNLEYPAVANHLYAAPDSVVRSALRDGVDGWRLDVAFDLGFKFLGEITRAAHAEKPGSLVVGELWNYPKEWFPSVDGVMNFTAREIILDLAKGEIEARTAGQMLERVVVDAGIEPMLKSWMVLDNHDVQRLASALPDVNTRRLAQLLQFTLPGAPNLYYGSELAMTSEAEDPAMRGPMRWDLALEDNPELVWTKQLIALRKHHRALRIGNFRLVSADKLLAFERYTDRAEETVIVIANPSDREVSESVMVANSKLMSMDGLINVLTNERAKESLRAALIKVRIPPKGFLVLKPNVRAEGGYTAYKRVQ